MDDQTKATYEKLKQIRTRTDLKVKPSKYLKPTFTGFDGVERPLVLRDYQIKGVLHLAAMPRFLLGDDTGLGKCKPLDSLVLTDKGLVPLGHLAPKGDLQADRFYPLDAPTKVWTGFASGWQPIKHYYCGGTKRTMRVTTQRGYETEGSLVHPLWVRNVKGEQFVRLQDVQVGDAACLYRGEADFPADEPILPIPSATDFGIAAKSYPVPDRLSPDLARLLGYIVAEGWVNSRYAVMITQHKDYNPEVYNDIWNLCLSVLGKQPAEGLHKDVSIHLSSVFLRAYLQGLGIDMSLSAGKCVPWPVLQGTQESVTAFLRGYFDGEASVSGSVLEVSSASERLLREVQLLLLRLGILSSRNQRTIKGKTYWRLALCGQDAVAFHAKVGLLTPHKREALEVLCSKERNANLDVVPFARDAVEALRAELRARATKHGSNDTRLGSGIKRFGFSFEKTLNNIRNGGRNPTYAFLAKLLMAAREVGAEDTVAFETVEGIYNRRYFYDPIKTVTQAEQEVADIEVGHPDHSFVADGFVNHNTLQSISALSYLWDANPDLKTIILTTKSAIDQWRDEFTKFTTGIKTFTVSGTKAEREAIYRAFQAATGPTVLIMGYRSAVNDFSVMQNWGGYVLITDEATAYKTPTTQVHKVILWMSKKAARVWALTATLIKNNLMEGYGIYNVLVPNLFNPNKNKFMIDFCVIKMQAIGRGRQVPIIVGYRKDDIARFREQIDPYFLGRPKHEVSNELPSLTMRDVKVAMTPKQLSKYGEAVDGLLNVIKEGAEEERETTKLTALIYCQQIVNDLGLLGYEGEDSPKLDALAELLDEDLEGEKVIVFTRFRKMVDIAAPYLKGKGIECVRITGDEDAAQRRDAAKRFQDPKDKARVCFITTAGAEAVNLQAAKAIIFYDSPWSAGDYLQCLDAETEILTKRGFVGREGIRKDDLVAAMDPVTSRVSWQEIQSITDRPLAAGEKMYALKNPQLDIRVTGGHRMLFRKQTTAANRVRVWPKEWRIQTAEDMAREPALFSIPVSAEEPSQGVPLTDAELQFIGWFLSDGTRNHVNSQVVITQSDHQPQITDLRDCLRACGFDWKEYHRNPPEILECFPNGKPQTAFSIPRGTAKGSRARKGWDHLATYLDKGLSDALEEVTPHQLGQLLWGLHLGDGSKGRNLAWTQRSYHIATGRKDFADRLQSLCVRKGFRCAVKKAQNKNVYLMHIKAAKDCRLSGHGDRPKFCLTESTAGEPVWCVENDVGTLITRRNGKVAIVGNCLGRMIRIGSQHDKVYAIHLITQGTIDGYVAQVLKRKMQLIESVLGKRLKGDGVATDDGQAVIENTNEVNDLFDSMVKDARTKGMK